MDDNVLAPRVSELEAALAQGQAALKERLDKETFERTEALLWQEHRVIAALRNAIVHRKHPDFRFAAVGGLISAVIGRSATTAALGGGLFALVATAYLALHANHLLAIQNEKMDVQTVVMDAQRRSQHFQVEFAAITSDVIEQVQEAMRIKGSADNILQEWTADVIETLTETAATLSPEHKERIVRGLIGIGQNAIQIPYLALNDFQRFRHTLDLLNSVCGETKEICSEQLLEHKRRSSSVVEKYMRMASNGRWSVSDASPFQVHFHLDPATSGRIASLSRASRPYPSLNARIVHEIAPSSISLFSRALFEPQQKLFHPVAELELERTSFERGHLLAFLTKHSISSESLEGSDFSSANLSGRRIGPGTIVDAPRTDYSSSRLSNLTFLGNAQESIFSCSILKNIDFRQAAIGRSSFFRAYLDNVILSAHPLSQTDLTQAHLVNVTIVESDVGPFNKDVLLRTFWRHDARNKPAVEVTIVFEGNRAVVNTVGGDVQQQNRLCR